LSPQNRSTLPAGRPPIEHQPPDCLAVAGTERVPWASSRPPIACGRLPGRGHLLGGLVLYVSLCAGWALLLLRPPLRAGAGLGLSLLSLLGGLLLLSRLCVSRPLRDSEVFARALAKGELQRQLASGSTATAELYDLQVAWEELRRSLLSRLRSSTEHNLQLEAEVARRSAELSRRNAELSDALRQLRATQDDLVRTEKLAAVGTLAASVTSAIYGPVRSMATVAAALGDELAALERQLDPAGADPTGLLAALAAIDRRLQDLAGDAQRVRDIVRALRLYARPQLPAAGPAPARAEPDPGQLAAIALLVAGAGPADPPSGPLAPASWERPKQIAG
jgi:hypothetical protein